MRYFARNSEWGKQDDREIDEVRVSFGVQADWGNLGGAACCGDFDEFYRLGLREVGAGAGKRSAPWGAAVKNTDVPVCGTFYRLGGCDVVHRCDAVLQRAAQGRGVSDAYAAGQGMAADHVKGRDRNGDGADQHGAGGGVHRSAESGRQSIRNRRTVSSSRGGMPEVSGEFPVRPGNPACGTCQHYDGSLQNLRIAFYRAAHGEASDHLECRGVHRHRGRVYPAWVNPADHVRTSDYADFRADLYRFFLPADCPDRFGHSVCVLRGADRDLPCGQRTDSQPEAESGVGVQKEAWAALRCERPRRNANQISRHLLLGAEAMQIGGRSCRQLMRSKARICDLPALVTAVRIATRIAAKTGRATVFVRTAASRR